MSKVKLDMKTWWFVGLLIGLAAVSPTEARAQSAERVYTNEELTDLPRLLSPSRAQRLIEESYPPDLKRAGIGGRVQVRFIIGADGKVEPESVPVLAATGAAPGDAAAKMVPKLEFRPGKIGDKAVRSIAVLPITYEVK